MKLKNLPNKESFESWTFRLRESEARTLKAYHDYAQEHSGVELSMPELLAAMVTSFMEDDRAFQTSLTKPKKKAAKAADHGSDVGTASPGYTGTGSY